MSNKETFDPAGYVQHLRNILSTVSVSGPMNIHAMDLTLQGLEYLYGKLTEAPEKQEEI